MSLSTFKQLSRYAPHTKFVFPNAPAIPIALNGGMLMPAWYDIRGSINQDQPQDEKGMLRSRQQGMLLFDLESTAETGGEQCF